MQFDVNIRLYEYWHEYSLPMVPRVLWYRGIYFVCSYAQQRHPPVFLFIYIHKHNSHIYRNVWSFCPNVLNFCKYTYCYLFLRKSGHFYFTLIPCFVKCPIIITMVFFNKYCVHVFVYCLHMHILMSDLKAH